MRVQAGTRVLLTGATGGIGGAIARAFAGRGAELLLTGRRAEVLEGLAREVGGRALAVDLTDRDALETLAREAAGVDVLVANAAIPASGALGSFTPAEVDRALDLNLRAPIVLAHRLAGGMVARGGGHLVFVSSIGGKTASPGTSVYSATKFGLRGFALGLREDLRTHGVGVSSIFPGFVGDAGMFVDSGARLPGYVGLKTTGQVADAILDAIERNRAEVDVAPLFIRAGAAIAQLAPELTGRVQRRLGAVAIARVMIENQREKR